MKNLLLVAILMFAVTGIASQPQKQSESTTAVIFTDNEIQTLTNDEMNNVVSQQIVPAHCVHSNPDGTFDLK